MAKAFQGGGGGGKSPFQAYQGEQVQSLAPGYLETLSNAYAQMGAGIAAIGKGIGQRRNINAEKEEKDKEKAKRDAVAIATAKAYAKTTVKEKDIEDGVKSGVLIKNPDGTVSVNPAGPEKPENIDTEKLDVYNKYIAKPDLNAADAEAFLATEEVKSKAAEAARKAQDSEMERRLKLTQIASATVKAEAESTDTALKVANFYAGQAGEAAQKGQAALSFGDTEAADRFFRQAEELKARGNALTEQTLTGGAGGPPGDVSRYAAPAAPSPERQVLGSPATTVSTNPAAASPAARGMSPATAGQMERIDRERAAANAVAPAEEQIPRTAPSAPEIEPAQPSATRPSISPSAALRGRQAPAAAQTAPAAQPAASTTPAAGTTPAAPAAPATPAAAQPAATPAAAPAQVPGARRITPRERAVQFDLESESLQNQYATQLAYANRLAAQGSPYAAQALETANKTLGRITEMTKVRDKVVMDPVKMRDELNSRFPQVGNWVSIGRYDALSGIDDLKSDAARQAFENLAYDPYAPAFTGTLTEVQDSVRDMTLLMQNLLETSKVIDSKMVAGDPYLDRFKLTTNDLAGFANGEVSQKFLLASLRKAIVSGGNFSDADREFILEAIPYLNSADPTRSAELMSKIVRVLGRMGTRMYESNLESKGMRYAPDRSQTRDSKEQDLRDKFNSTLGDTPTNDDELRAFTQQVRANARASGVSYSRDAQVAAQALVDLSPNRPRR